MSAKTTLLIIFYKYPINAYLIWLSAYKRTRGREGKAMGGGRQWAPPIFLTSLRLCPSDRPLYSPTDSNQNTFEIYKLKCTTAKQGNHHVILLIFPTTLPSELRTWQSLEDTPRWPLTTLSHLSEERRGLPPWEFLAQLSTPGSPWKTTSITYCSHVPLPSMPWECSGSMACRISRFTW